MKKILCLLADGFEDIEAIATIDLLRRAKLEVTTCGLNRREVTSSAGIRVFADTVIDELIDEYDLLFLPGGKGVGNLESDHRVIDIILDFHNQKKWIAAICAAPSILGKLDLLDNEVFTCYPTYEKYMPYGDYHPDNVVISNHFITGRGIGGVFDFSLEIIKLLTNEVTRDKVKHSAVIK